MVGWRARVLSFIGKLGNYPDDRASCARLSSRRIASLFAQPLEHVMNLAEKPHQDADCMVSSVHRRSPVFRIRKPFLSESITASNQPGGRVPHRRGSVLR